jgi:2'-5' RNA ligase
MEKTFRAFIAISLSPEIRRWLAEARVVLEAGLPPASVRWTDVNGIHITLKFLGEVPIDSVEGIRSAMDRAARGCRPFSLAVEGLGCFPDAARPRVIWAGVRREPALSDLQKRLEDGLEQAGFPRERRAFSPHLTLGRVRDGVSGKELAEIGRAVQSAEAKAAVGMDISGYGLYKSVLRPTGAEYSLQYQVAFGP